MNIYDIAREAGVSIATISRVINGKERVSKETRERVEEVLKKHQYSPNAIARGLVVNSMKTVGVLTIDIRDIYYANTAYTIEQELSKLGYNVILCNTGNDAKKKESYMNSLIEKKVDGMIFVGSVFKDAAIEKTICRISEKVPVVMLNGQIEADNIYSVICDDDYGISLCVDYLYSKGYKEMVYLKDTDTFSAKAKVEGFKRGMRKNGLEIKPGSVVKVSKGLTGGYDGVKRLLSQKRSFSAIVTGEDIIAVGAVKRLVEEGRSIPQDVAVTGFNNSVIARCCTPELTSVDSRMELLSMNSVMLLCNVLDGKEMPKVTRVTPELVIRGSA